MKNLDYTGLNKDQVAPVVKALNELLADFQLYYTNLRGFHWNVKGKAFFQLHEQYERFYDDAAEKIDEIAERILQLDGTPESRFSEYLKMTSIKEDGYNPSTTEGLQSILDTLKVLVAKEREILDLAGEANDEVTTALMGDYLSSQEKSIWMLTSTLS